MITIAKSFAQHNQELNNKYEEKSKNNIQETQESKSKLKNQSHTASKNYKGNRKRGIGHLH